MARIRTIKPGFFRHVSLYDGERETGFPLRIAFAGLWTCADREGRFKWEPRELKLDCLPHDEVDFSKILDALASVGVIVKYENDQGVFGFIPSWKKHQVINQREAKSELPVPTDDTHVRARADTTPPVHVPTGVNIPDTLRQTVFARDGNVCVRCKSPSDLTIDHIFPRSIGGTHAITNLRTLCRPCNSGRPVAGQGLIDDLARDGLSLSDMERTCVHVHAHGEGKGREQEGKGRDTATPRTSPALSPTDLQKELWRTGVAFLQSNNIAEERARSLIGQLRQKHDDVAIIKAFAAAESNGTPDPIPFIQAVLAGKVKHHAGQSRLSEHPLGIFGQLADELRSVS